MGKIVLLEVDLYKGFMATVDSANTYDLEFIRSQTDPVYMINVSLDVDDDSLLKTVKSDPLILAQMVEASSAVYQSALEQLKAPFENIDAARAMMVSKATSPAETGQQQTMADVVMLSTASEEWRNALEDAKDNIANEAPKKAMEAYDTWISDKQDYKNYKVAISVEIAVDITNVGVSALGVVGGAPTLFGAILGIYGLVKGVVGLLDKCYVAQKSADQQKDKVIRDITALKKRYGTKMAEDTANRARAAAEEKVKSAAAARHLPNQSPQQHGAAAFNNAPAFQVAPAPMHHQVGTKQSLVEGSQDLFNRLMGNNWLTTVGGARSSLGTFQSKNTGVDLKCHPMAEALQKSLVEVKVALEQIEPLLEGEATPRFENGVWDQGFQKKASSQPGWWKKRKENRKFNALRDSVKK